MPFSIEKTKKQLPIRYLALPIFAIVMWIVPFHDVALNVFPLVFFPLWIFLGQILYGFSCVITSLSLKRGVAFWKSAFSVYGKMGSVIHLQAAVLVAMLEEAIFRYALLFYVYDSSGSVLLAILGTSVLFSALHVRRGFRLARILVYVDYFVFALILGAISLATNSIYPAVILHAMRNYILRCLLISKEEYRKLYGTQELDGN